MDSDDGAVDDELTDEGETRAADARAELRDCAAAGAVPADAAAMAAELAALAVAPIAVIVV